MAMQVRCLSPFQSLPRAPPHKRNAHPRLVDRAPPPPPLLPCCHHFSGRSPPPTPPPSPPPQQRNPLPADTKRRPLVPNISTQRAEASKPVIGKGVIIAARYAAPGLSEVHYEP